LPGNVKCLILKGHTSDGKDNLFAPAGRLPPGPGFYGFLPAPPPVAQKPAEIKWQKIDEGLETAEIISP
jgi:hypothetical protein